LTFLTPHLPPTGFSHSAFTFAHESLVSRSLVADAEVPPGALVTFLQKGLQYIEVESHLQEDGTERACDEPFHLLYPHICRVNSNVKSSIPSTGRGLANEIPAEVIPTGVDIPLTDVSILYGHTSEVFTCMFNPKNPEILATGSGDGTARIWNLSNSANQVVLKHNNNILLDNRVSKDKTKDISSLDWNVDGSKLATACYDGKVRIWSLDGTLLQTLSGHTSPIFSTQWSPSSNHVLSGGVDKTAIVWDPVTGLAVQSFAYHSAPILDVEWATDSTFATCSSDKTIVVSTVGSKTPTRTFVGHMDEVNAISWAPSHTMLVSGSDDWCARIWSTANPEKDACLAVLSGHKKSIYNVKWAPAGEGSANPNAAPSIATASFDATVKLWDPTTGKVRHTLSKHQAMVYAINFSPDAQFLVSGSSDRNVYVWSTKDGSLVKSYQGSAGVFDVAFDSSGTRVAASCSDNNVAVIDLRM
jgi:transducin (beta)-like 1